MARKLRKGDRFICEIVFTGQVDDDKDGVFDFHVPGLNGGRELGYEYMDDTVYVNENAFEKLLSVETYNDEARKQFADPGSIEAFLGQIDG